jgi:prolyl-tRNA editing enzyme YbaK/EbsC (Cys-tRNA(Pro) deacylase)
VFKLSHDVITCEEAAKAKGIPLENELKTLVITTGARTYALHLPGDKKASLRKVKQFLGTEQACLISPRDLAEMGLSPGTVSPVIDPVWSLSHLVSARILDLPYVSTNGGTRREYFKFDPKILLNAREVAVGEFEA